MSCMRWMMLVGAMCWQGLAQAALLSLDVTADPVMVGDLVEVVVGVDDVSGLAGFEFTLAYDELLLEGVSLVSDEIFGVGNTLELQNSIGGGSATLSELSWSFSGIDVTTPTPLATLTFMALSPGVSALRFEKGSLSDAIGASVAGSVMMTNGSLEVAAAPQVTEPGVALLLLLPGWWLLRRRHHLVVR